MLVDVIPTSLTPAAAELTLVTVPDDPAPTQAEMHGHLVGPSCAYAETIEVAYPVKPLPRESEFVRGRVVVPEPSLWTPTTPFTYRARLAVKGEGSSQAAEATITIKDLKLHPKRGLRLNGERLQFVGHHCRSLMEEEGKKLSRSGVNLLVAPLTQQTAGLWPLANRLGFFMLGIIDPEDDVLLWHASDILNREPSTFGWLFPQDLIGQPQRWHNAMSLLHGSRPDVFIGIKVEQLPLGALPGHVAFAVAEPNIIEGLAAQGLPCLGLLPRGEEPIVPELQSAWLGWIRRDVA